MQGVEDIGEDGAQRLGDIVKRARTRKGWTQQELAELSGSVLAKSTVQTIEAGNSRRPSLRTLMGLRQAFNWGDDWLEFVLRDEEPPPRTVGDVEQLREVVRAFRMALEQLERFVASRQG